MSRSLMLPDAIRSSCVKLPVRPRTRPVAFAHLHGGRLMLTAPADSPLWFREPGYDLRVNGVFKGGGAKGLLYGGALQAVAAEKLWFRAVAGASAGAITATLIAAGLSADELIDKAPVGLHGVKKMPLGDLVGSPLFRTTGLSAWLEGVLQAQVSTLRKSLMDGPVTFSALFEATGIELYVVAVDVADRQPRVFSVFTTPHLPVTPAVLASSAIPLAFRPGRLRVRDGQTEAVHRLMDGGVWANYPAFVFREPSFRAFHGLEPVPGKSLTVGFTLDTTEYDAHKEVIGFEKGTAHVSRDKGSFSPWLFRNPFVRFYLMTLVPLIVAAQFLYTVNAAGLVFLKDYATRDGVPEFATRAAGYMDGFVSHFSPALWSIVAVLVLAALLAAVLGGTLMDSGVPAMRTLMSVGTDVPYWVGAHPDDHVVRLSVPPWLKTTSFALSEPRIAEAVTLGRAQAEEQLRAILAA